MGFIGAAWRRQGGSVNAMLNHTSLEYFFGQLRVKGPAKNPGKDR
jgi:hypothetical protein